MYGSSCYLTQPVNTELVYILSFPFFSPVHCTSTVVCLCVCVINIIFMKETSVFCYFTTCMCKSTAGTPSGSVVVETKKSYRRAFHLLRILFACHPSLPKSGERMQINLETTRVQHSQSITITELALKLLSVTTQLAHTLTSHPM